MEVKIIAGLNRDEGAFYAGDCCRNFQYKLHAIAIKDGISKAIIVRFSK